VVLARTLLDDLAVNGTVFCDGDDVLLFVDKAAIPTLSQLESWYLQWGFRMKVEAPAFEPEQVEFCQAKPVCVDGAWTLVRNVFKALNTDGFIHQQLTEAQRMTHIRAVGLCGLSMAAGVPILQEFYSSLVKSGKTGKFDLDQLGGKWHQMKIQVRSGHLAKARPISDSTRVSFMHAFGVIPSDQVIWEEMLRADFSRPANDIRCLRHDRSFNCSISDRYSIDNTVLIH